MKTYTPTELRRIDALVAELMGYTFTESPDDSTATEVRQWYKHTAHGKTEWRVIVSEPYLHRGYPKERPYQHSWKNYEPTTNSAQAMEVLKWIREQDVIVAIHGDVLSQICGKRIEVEAPTLELAICLFALKLKGVEP